MSTPYTASSASTATASGVLRKKRIIWKQVAQNIQIGVLSHYAMIATPRSTHNTAEHSIERTSWTTQNYWLGLSNN